LRIAKRYAASLVITAELFRFKNVAVAFEMSDLDPNVRNWVVSGPAAIGS
jgi:hypothetical protein